MQTSQNNKTQGDAMLKKRSQQESYKPMKGMMKQVLAIVAFSMMVCLVPLFSMAKDNLENFNPLFNIVTP
jgi:quinol-cytochrome oxidoreductase complex cytochrome b subunit